MEANLQTLTSSCGAGCKSLTQSESMPPALSDARAALTCDSAHHEVKSVSSGRRSHGSPRQWPPIVFRALTGDAGPGFHLCVPNQPPLVVSYQQLAELV